MALDSINSSSGEAARHLIGRGIEREMAAPLDSFIAIQLNQHLSSAYRGHSFGQTAAESWCGNPHSVPYKSSQSNKETEVN